MTLDDVTSAIPHAVTKHTITSDYLLATRSPRPDSLFAQVLLACALAPKNRLGYVTAGAIREPLEVVAGRNLEIPAFARHLKQLLEPDRGAVLQREGEPRRYFYRFADPIMQTCVILHGLSCGLVADDQVLAFTERAGPGPDAGETTSARPLLR